MSLDQATNGESIVLSPANRYPLPQPMPRQAGRSATALASAVSLAALVLSGDVAATASPVCGQTGSHIVCVTLPASTLTGPVPIGVTNDPNRGHVSITWVPDGGGQIELIRDGAPSGTTGDYSFTWPTQKYSDATGSLQVRFGDRAPFAVGPVTLSNGGIQPEPPDWQTYLPPPTWNGDSDPTIVAVGDAADDQVKSDRLFKKILKEKAPLFLYLGDVYEHGTATEMLDHYGAFGSSPGAGTLWGRLASATQPTIGNHESSVDPNGGAWTDYWHQRPLSTAFTFAGAVFIDLDSSLDMTAGSPQYRFVQDTLSSVPPSTCVVGVWHIPAYWLGAQTPGQQDMWSLLASNGGDLVLNGHQHTMVQWDLSSAPAPVQDDPAMVELISGAGGHLLDDPESAPGAIWTSPSRKTLGYLRVRLVGAAHGGTPTSLQWSFVGVDGSVLHQDSRAC